MSIVEAGIPAPLGRGVVNPVFLSIEETRVLNARRAIRNGIEYAQMCLKDHETALGRTTLKNRSWAERMESDIEEMVSALAMLPVPEGANDRTELPPPDSDGGSRKEHPNDK